jgi:hypothetical protein
MAMRFLRHHENELNRLLIACECHVQVPLTRHFVSLELPTEKVEMLIGELSECKCCLRHSSFCPPCLLPGDSLPETPEDHKRTEQEKGQCKCMCRHYVRMLCRAYGHLSEIANFEADVPEVAAKPPIPPLPLLPPVKMAVSSLVN